jgi:cation:H+ antiporter
MSLVLLIAGLVLVVAGAEVFFDGLVSTARTRRLPPFVLTLVVSGFELENLAAGIAANAKGLGDAAAGTFLGATTFLALGVAGLSALVSPIRAALPLQTFVWAAAAPLPTFLLARDGMLSRIEGALLLVWFAVALTGLARAGKGLPVEEPKQEKRHPIARMLVGLAVLTGAGELLGRGIKETVARFGISEALLGNTAIAASVEAEEVARVAVPSRRGRGDLALANIIGTIVHFIAFNAGVIALVKPIELSRESLDLHVPAALASVVVLAVVLAIFGRIERWLGTLLLAAYVGHVVASILIA